MTTLGKLKLTQQDILNDIAVLEDMAEYGEDYIIRLLMLILTKASQINVPPTVAGQFEATRLREKCENLRKALDYSTDMNLEQIKLFLGQD